MSLKKHGAKQKIISTSTLTLHSLEVSKQASFQEPSSLWYRFILNVCTSTLQGTNISHLGKRKIIDSKVLAGEGICSFPGGYMYSKQVYIRIKICICIVKGGIHKSPKNARKRIGEWRELVKHANLRVSCFPRVLLYVHLRSCSRKKGTPPQTKTERSAVSVGILALS